MKQLIINADDFGLTPGVNQGIITAHRQGVLTSTTLMAGGLAWQQAVELARSTPSLGVGIHLTLTALKPVLSPERIPSLVDKEGNFRRQFWRAPLWNQVQVKKEWRAQIVRLLEAGLRPTHLDSHHHVHLWPGLVDVVAGLAREFDISAVRFISPHSFKLMNIGGYRRQMAVISWRRARRLPLAQPKTVVGLETVSADLSRYLSSLDAGPHELYTHPGSPNDEDLAAISSLTAGRVKETELLCSQKFQHVLAKANVRLVNYSQLGRG